MRTRTNKFLTPLKPVPLLEMVNLSEIREEPGSGSEWSDADSDDPELADEDVLFPQFDQQLKKLEGLGNLFSNIFRLCY